MKKKPLPVGEQSFHRLKVVRDGTAGWDSGMGQHGMGLALRGSSKNDKIIIVIVMTKSNDTLITSLSEDGMNKSRREIVNKFITDALEILGGHLVRTVLYGSYARGDYRENSDIDLLFLTNSSDEENREQESRLYDLAFEYEMDYGVDISVIVKSRDHFEYWLGALPFYDNIESEGMVLYG